MDIYTHATGKTDELAVSVAALEVHCARVFARPVVDFEHLQRAIRITWPQIITAAQNARVSPQVEYVASLYNRLVKEMNLNDAGDFTDRTDVPWLEIYTAGCGDESRCEDAWVIAELFWGGYVKFLHLTLGWLLMNGIRIQQKLLAITPSPNSADRFTDYLRWSGPGTFDAGSLRDLFYEYEMQEMANNDRDRGQPCG